jgi:hypothetical protein
VGLAERLADALGADCDFSHAAKLPVVTTTALRTVSPHVRIHLAGG